MSYKITVIMGIYNCSSTLEEALNSLVVQTYTNWKLVLCDDGSTDETYKIAERYSELHENINLIRNSENLGLPATLNHCLEYADTDYIARMDGDDISLPERFAMQLEFLEQNLDYAIVSNHIYLFDENGKYATVCLKEFPEVIDFIHGTPHCHASAMVRKDVLDQVSGYNPLIKRAQDYDLWARVYELGFKGSNLQTPLYLVRDDRSAASRRTLSVRFAEVKLRLGIFKRLNLPFWSVIYIFKPIIQGMIPVFIHRYLRTIIYGK